MIWTAPPPSSVTWLPPSIVVSTSVRTVSVVVIGIVVAPPHENVIVPPAASAVTNPACVHDVTTVVGLDVSTGMTGAPHVGPGGVIGLLSTTGPPPLSVPLPLL